MSPRLQTKVDNKPSLCYGYATAQGGCFMSTIDDVLAALTQADAPVSGEWLARKLDVTRNAVWKAINQLRP